MSRDCQGSPLLLPYDWRTPVTTTWFIIHTGPWEISKRWQYPEAWVHRLLVTLCAPLKIFSSWLHSLPVSSPPSQTCLQGRANTTCCSNSVTVYWHIGGFFGPSLLSSLGGDPIVKITMLPLLLYPLLKWVKLDLCPELKLCLFSQEYKHSAVFTSIIWLFFRKLRTDSPKINFLTHFGLLLRLVVIPVL